MAPITAIMTGPPRTLRSPLAADFIKDTPAAAVPATLDTPAIPVTSLLEASPVLEKVAAIEWVQILRDAGAIQPDQIDALLKWIDKNDRIYSSTLTSLCRVTALTASLGDLSLQLSSRAFDQLAASRGDASSRPRRN